MILPAFSIWSLYMMINDKCIIMINLHVHLSTFFFQHLHLSSSYRRIFSHLFRRNKTRATAGPFKACSWPKASLRCPAWTWGHFPGGEHERRMAMDGEWWRMVLSGEQHNDTMGIYGGLMGSGLNGASPLWQTYVDSLRTGNITI